MRKIMYFWVICILIGCSKTKMPSTFLIDPEALVANKQKIVDGDKALTEALTGLEEEAGEVLTLEPFSVTYKTKFPPSGDKHDYMSQAPYYWPDTTKPDGLPYIRRDGIVNPERNEISDCLNFRAMCYNVRLLAVVYYYTNNSRYATKAVELLRVWFLNEATRMNPHLNYGQGIPGISEGRGVGLIDTRYWPYLVDGIQILKACGKLTNAEYDALQVWLRQFLDWMTTSPLGMDEAKMYNNHGTYYDVQTITLSLFTGQHEHAVQIIHDITKARIESQFTEEGSQPHELERTNSWFYSQMNLSGFFELARLAENVDIDLWNYVSPGKKSIKGAYRWMLSHADDQPWEYQQITPIDKTIFVQLAHIATVKYPDVDASAFLETYRDKPDNLFILTQK